MRGLLFAALLLPLAAHADTTMPPAALEPPSPPVPACGGPGWLRMREAVAGYCANEAAPSEARGCRIVLRAYDTCGDLRLSVDDGPWSANLRDPSNQSFAWFLSFERRGAKLVSFRHMFDDCDCC
jgi:hypothetical protein